MQGQTIPRGGDSQDLAKSGKGDMARFSVRPSNSGSGWDVVDLTFDRKVSTHDTNRGAWYTADKMNLEAVNRQQTVSEWAFTKKANDE